MCGKNNESPGVGAFLTFWTAQAIGILVKGPITPLVSLLTIGCLTAADRDARWLRAMKPLRGLAIVAVIASPWAIAIALATGGAFFHQSLVGDMLSKVASGQESHGFPTGLLPPSDAAYALAGIGAGRSIGFSGMEIAVCFRGEVLPCVDNTCMDFV